ncbi:MAG: prolipoprotein diacylglyceryl transferase [Chloroflexi bacterium]|nr:prolipoprotein diacylglyceryl transferase [Chloroflexota bacterium]
MHPILVALDLGPATVTVTAYAAFLCVAALAAGALGVRAARSLGVGTAAAAAGIVAAVVVGLVGARLLSLALDWPAYAADPARIVEPRLRGFALYGGLAAGSVAMVVAARRWRVSPALVADRAVVAVVAGVVLVRVGCFLNGCCAGVATDLPWGMVFPPRAGAADLAAPGGFGFLAVMEEPAHVHPTQLYEIAAVIACGALAWAFARRGAPPGAPALLFAAGFLAFRAADQVLRVPSPEASVPGPSMVLAYAVVASAVAVAAAAWWRRGREAGAGRRGGGAARSPAATPPQPVSASS